MNTSKLKSGTVTVIKTIVAPVHVTLQASADLLALGEAKLINKIDGTPVFESVMQRTAFTQNKIESVVAKAMEIKERREAKKEQDRQKHVDSLKAKLDVAEGVTHTPEIVIPAPPTPEELNVFKTPMQAFGNEYVPVV
jgi:hypothetical protein